ncbi:MAG TPA: PrsW family glutamic-type intramembrane protease [Chloroflexota bacterium]|nr:PrsW family glutamic-type intramembrane protease [Chloroflexota bacterium]
MGLAISSVLLWAIVPTLLIVVGLRWLDRYEREPWAFCLASVLAGLIAFGLAVLLENLLRLPLHIYPATFVVLDELNPWVPIVEQLAKAVSLLGLVFWIGEEFDDFIDGIFYGALVGAGFALGQDGIYFALAYGRFGNIIEVGWPTYLAAVISSVNHCLYSAIFGGALGVLRSVARPARYLWLPPAALLVGIGLQLAHDYLVAFVLTRAGEVPAEALASLGLVANATNWLGIAALGLLVAIAWTRQLHVLQVELASEVAAGVISDEDYRVLLSGWGRLPREARFAVARGLRRSLQLRRYHELAAELAFAKWHRRLGGRFGLRRRLPPEEYRQQLQTLRAELFGAGGG